MMIHLCQDSNERLGTLNCFPIPHKPIVISISSPCHNVVLVNNQHENKTIFVNQNEGKARGDNNVWSNQHYAQSTT
jgi:hypothetical protein